MREKVSKLTAPLCCALYGAILSLSAIVCLAAGLGAEAPRSYSAAAILARPNLKCSIVSDATPSPERSVTLFTDDDGYARFSAVKAIATTAVKRLTLQCVDTQGHASSYVVDLTAAETFEPHPLDVANVPGVDRPALVGDPMSYSMQSLLDAGYGLRPDPERQPGAYRRWLQSASHAARLTTPQQFTSARPAARSAVSVPAAQMKGMQADTQTVTDELSSDWLGAVLGGAANYSYVEGTFNVPAAIPAGDGTGYTEMSIWDGLDGEAAPVQFSSLTPGGLIQTGVTMRTTPSVANYVIFREYCCGNTNSTDIKLFTPNPGDQIYAVSWYCDAQGSLNLNGGYGCTYLHDLTTQQVMSCTSSSPSAACPSAQAFPLCTQSAVEHCEFRARTAEFILENQSNQVNASVVSASDFTPQISFVGSAWSDTLQLDETVSTDPSVELKQDGTGSLFTQVNVSISGADTVFSVNPALVPQSHSIWQSTSAPCSGATCGGWVALDDNPLSVSIAADVGLYQLQANGALWHWTGTDCVSASCTGWQLFDTNPLTKTIVTDNEDSGLYQIHTDGEIWKSTGVPCNGVSCTGWMELDDNPDTLAITASAGNLYQLHRSGQIWMYTNPGWRMLDANPATTAIVADFSALYQLHNTGEIWKWTGTNWIMLDDNPAAVSIAASGGYLFQHHSDGSIWKWNGAACVGRTCSSWTLLDNNTLTTAIVADASKLYQLHQNGEVWRWTGVTCSGSSCPGWTMLDNNPKTIALTAGGGHLFQLHGN